MLISKAILGMKSRRREIRREERKKQDKEIKCEEMDVSTTPIRMVALIQIFLDWDLDLWRQSPGSLPHCQSCQDGLVASNLPAA